MICESRMRWGLVVALLGLLAAPASAFTGGLPLSRPKLAVRAPIKVPVGPSVFGQPRKPEPLKSAAASDAGAVKPGMVSRVRKAMIEDGGWQKTATVAVATCFSWYLNNKLGNGPVKGAAITGSLFGALMPAHLKVPALCGAFTGMCSDNMAPEYALVARLGISSGLLLTLADRKEFIVGRGGRLGVVALITCTLTWLFDRALPMVSSAIPVPPVAPWFDPVAFQVMLSSGFMKAVSTCMAVSVAAAFAQRKLLKFLQNNSPIQRIAHPVFAASFVTLLCCSVPGWDGPALAGVSVALSAPKTLPVPAALFLASALGEFVRFMLAGSVVDWGGRIGTAATIGVIATYRLGKHLVPALAEPKEPAPAPAPAAEPKEEPAAAA